MKPFALGLAIILNLGLVGAQAEEKIFFMSSRARTPGTQQFHLWMINPDGTGIEQLTFGHVYDGGPQLSPDGRTLVFSRSAPEQPDCRSILTLDLVTRQEVIVVDGTPGDTYTNSGPTWSPGGSHIAFERHVARSTCQGAVPGANLWTVDYPPDSGAPVQISSGSLRSSLQPSWKPDGTNIAFQAELGGAGPWEIYTIAPPAPGGVEQSLFPRVGTDGCPRYSPDGTKITWVRNGSTAYVADVADPVNTQIQISPSSNSFSNPAWSPDGSKMVMNSHDDDLWVVDADGSGPMPLTGPGTATGDSIDVQPWWGDGNLSGVEPSACVEQLITEGPSLEELATGKIAMGAAVNHQFYADPTHTAQGYQQVIDSQFNLLVPENSMKFKYIHPFGPPAGPGCIAAPESCYDFSDADDLVKFAHNNNMKVRGHTLVWGEQLPFWLTDLHDSGFLSRDTAIAILEDHIGTVMEHFVRDEFPNTVVAWDVVNEAITDDWSQLLVCLFREAFLGANWKCNLDEDSFWYKAIGPDYVEKAFQAASATGSGALLFYNDFGGEGLSLKSAAIYRMLRDLRTDGIQVDGVGLQTHLFNNEIPRRELELNMRRLANLGLKIHITEMDVRFPTHDGIDPTELCNQAEQYADVLEACLSVPNCEALVTWGVADHHSWITRGDLNFEDDPCSSGGTCTAPLLFGQNEFGDDDYCPKPAFDAVKGILQGMQFSSEQCLSGP